MCWQGHAYSYCHAGCDPHGYGDSNPHSRNSPYSGADIRNNRDPHANPDVSSQTDSDSLTSGRLLPGDTWTSTDSWALVDGEWWLALGAAKDECELPVELLSASEAEIHWTGASSTLDNVASMNMGVTFDNVRGDHAYLVRITPLGVVRGKEAWQRVLADNPGPPRPSPPPSGFEYLLVRVREEYLEGPSAGAPYDVVDFDSVSANGWIYYWQTFPSVAPPAPNLNVTLYPGGCHEGWQIFQVAQDDPLRLLVYDMDPGEPGWSLVADRRRVHKHR